MSGERQLRIGREDPDVVSALPDPVTNVVSENPISWASVAMVAASRPAGGSGTTHSWFPANGTSVNTSTSRNATSTAGSIAVATLGAPRV